MVSKTVNQKDLFNVDDSLSEKNFNNEIRVVEIIASMENLKPILPINIYQCLVNVYKQEQILPSNKYNYNYQPCLSKQ